MVGQEHPAAITMSVPTVMREVPVVVAPTPIILREVQEEQVPAGREMREVQEVQEPAALLIILPVAVVVQVASA